jgi:hypothetical protein
MPRNLQQHVAADDKSASFAHSCARHEQLCERVGKAFAVTCSLQRATTAALLEMVSEAFVIACHTLFLLNGFKGHGKEPNL